MQFIKIVAETIIGKLFGIDVFLDSQLYFAEEKVHKQDVDQNVASTQTEPVFDSYNLEEFSSLADLFDLFKYSDNLGFF